MSEPDMETRVGDLEQAVAELAEWLSRAEPEDEGLERMHQRFKKRRLAGDA